MTTCAVDGCNERAKCRGWCAVHYTRWRRHGDPLTVAYAVGDPLARFMAKVEKGQDCWLWVGYVTPAGYGKFGAGGHRGSVWLAHRWSYEHFVGPIGEGQTIDHGCHNRSDCRGGAACLHRRCVNPSHLEPVTNGENLARSPNAPQNRTHCPKGHPYDEANTGWYKGWRNCRECKRDRENAIKQAEAAVRTHCRNGHPYDENTIVGYKGQRICRTCRGTGRKPG